MTAVPLSPESGMQPVSLARLVGEDIGRPVVVMALNGSVSGILDGFSYHRQREAPFPGRLTGDARISFGVSVEGAETPTWWDDVPLAGSILIDRSTPPKLVDVTTYGDQESRHVEAR
jgi:hypothetical protein